MSRKRKPTRMMKIKGKRSKNESYSLKEDRMKKGIFSKNSPFNPSNHRHHRRTASTTVAYGGGSMNDGRIDRMIEKNRGVSDEQLMRTKLKVDESRQATV